MSTIIQLRNDTAANWIEYNPILAEGEVGVENDTNKFKIGDGVNTWTNRPYFNGDCLVKSVNGQTGVVIITIDGITTQLQLDAINSGATTTNIGQITTNKNAIGTLTSLTTTVKTDLVSAVNEVNLTAGSKVSDVKVDGTSVVSEGVASISLSGYIQNTDYAGSSDITNKTATNKYLSPSTINNVASVSARSIYDKAVAITSGAISLDEGSVFYTDSPSAATTYTISTTNTTQSGFTYRYFNVLINMPSTAVGLDFTTNNTVTWTEDETPDMSESGRTYLLAFQSFDGGTSWIGSLATWWTTPTPQGV